ncbi:Kae1-associated serine/threonine protein kinase, partial [Candidatus Woesearchaeota archaeon]|nr:Kae1-associated serine/threonine protein kinase [Candidatus Woesearchaeota archaeon]
MKTKIAQGAEAVIYTDDSVVEKDRFEKKYRHPELDTRLRKTRTRREAKILSKLAEAGVHAPDLIEMDD